MSWYGMSWYGMVLMLFGVTVFWYGIGGVYAHSGGPSFEEVVGMYTIDIGYDVEKVVEGERVVFDFSLKEKGGERTPFSSVWARIEQDSETVLATGIATPSVGLPTLLWVPPGTGETKLFVRFERGDGSLAESTMVFEVQKSPRGSLSYVSHVAAGGLVLAIFFIARRFLHVPKGLS